jgi:CheY-like chemotaxis protein
MTRILVVDDNDDACTSLATLCALWGHEVAMAHEGNEALVAWEAFRPEVVLLDLDLPGLDGWEVARRIRAAEGGGVYILALSGWYRLHEKARAKLAGCDEFLLKPADLRGLRNLLDVAPARIATRTAKRSS